MIIAMKDERCAVDDIMEIYIYVYQRIDRYAINIIKMKSKKGNMI